MMKIRLFWLVLYLSALCIVSCSKKNHTEPKSRIIKTGSGFGYQILKKEKVFIDQPFIPAVIGEQQFKDSLQALKTANLVIKKITKKSFPRISIDELDSMKIEYEIQKFQ